MRSRCRRVCAVYCSVRWRPRRVRSDLLEVPEVMSCAALYILEAVEGGLRLLEVLEVRRRCAVCYSVCRRS